MNTGLDDSAASGSLPAVVSNYLAASDRDAIDAIVACFTEDAVVLDEDRHWRGAEAIRQWCENVATAFEYTVAISGRKRSARLTVGNAMRCTPIWRATFPAARWI